MSVYVVDSNFFMQAHRQYYPLDVFPSFWLNVKQLADDGKILSIDKVKTEIYRNPDDLKTWVSNNLSDAFFENSAIHINQYRQIVTWALSKGGHYLPKAVNDFIDTEDADAWLISYALADNGNRVVVTYEKSQPEAKNKIKIPDVCLAHGVQICSPIEMFRQTGLKI